MGNVIERLFQKLLAARFDQIFLFSSKQTAFKRGDRIADNACQAIIKDHIKDLKPLHLCFMDVRKAFDSVLHQMLLVKARRMKLPDLFVSYLRSYYSGLTTGVRIGRDFSDRIQCGQGVRQGDTLSPILFNIVIDWVLTDIACHRPGFPIGDPRVCFLAFADDLAALSRDELVLKRMVRVF